MNDISHNFPVEGEFRCVLKDKNGNVKQDTGVIKNVLTHNGMYALLGVRDTSAWTSNDGRTAGQSNASISTNLLDNCAVGDGVAVPNENDVKLANIVACVKDEYNGNRITTVTEHPTDSLHPGFVKVTSSITFQFKDIDNKNISEVGLVTYMSKLSSPYCLLTHANIVDGTGKPTTITVAKDDLFEVTYNFSVYININRTSGTFNLKKVVDGVETNEEYEYICQPFAVKNVYCANEYSMYYPESYGILYMYPGKEDVSSVNSSYSLESLLEGCNYKSIDAMMKRVATFITASSINENNVVYEKEVDKNFNKISRKVKLWFKTAAFRTGIRAWSINVTSHGTIVNYLIVVKNKANGQGVMKTDKQTWTLDHSISFSRMPK